MTCWRVDMMACHHDDDHDDDKNDDDENDDDDDDDDDDVKHQAGLYLWLRALAELYRSKGGMCVSCLLSQ